MAVRLQRAEIAGGQFPNPAGIETMIFADPLLKDIFDTLEAAVDVVRDRPANVPIEGIFDQKRATPLTQGASGALR